MTTYLTTLAKVITIVIGSVCTAFLFFSCQHQDSPKTYPTEYADRDSILKNRLIAMDTLSAKRRSAYLERALDELEQEQDYKDNPYYWIVKSFHERSLNSRDSIRSNLSNVDSMGLTPDIYALKEYLLINEQIAIDKHIDAERMEQIIHERNKIERSQSVFVYLWDDLLAMSFYNNHDPNKSLYYVKEYMMHHPLRSNDRMRQRYYDIRFMIAQRVEDTVEMEIYLDSCRQLAVAIQDSAALMRSYDYEGQLYSLHGRHDQAIASFRKFFNYHQRTGKLQFYMFNNLAKAFYESNQLDSTIKYLEMSEEWGKQTDKRHVRTLSELDMLSDAYASKGDFRKAWLIKTKQYEDFKTSTLELQREKMAEISTKYETQKKDHDIQMLTSTNTLNRQILVQQRWIFVILFVLLVFALVFTYKMYKEKLLKAKHDQLVLENKQYLLEQKNRQNQLNPHFIYNSIANLQGLIGADQKQEANRYLVALTKLIRDILELNRQDFITLGQEVRSLHNYIILQQMRFSESFAFTIETNDLDVDEILIPPMLVQPFVENAIEYGMKNIAYKGLLHIIFSQDEDYLIVSITDNGLGVQTTEQENSNKQSLAQVITRERLALLYGAQEHNASLALFPNYLPSGRGYKVEIRMPLKYSFN